MRERNNDYQDKIRRYRVTNLYRTFLLVAAIVVVAVIVWMQYSNHVYTAYDVVSVSQVEKSADSVNTALGKSILTYSKDGAHCSNDKGEVSWNRTYEIQNLKLAKNGGTVAIGNYNGRDIYVLNESQEIDTITTNMPVRDIAVAEDGTLTAVLADTDVTWINTYTPTGKQIFSGQAHMSNSGYPAAVALSPDGRLLEVSYIYVDSGKVKTTVAFYNFGSVGDNYKDYLVSGFDYSDTIVPEVGFLNNSSAYAVGDDRLVLYQGSEQPSSKSLFLYDKEIKSVFTGEGYIGLVLRSDKAEYDYFVDIYNSDGLVCKYYFSMDYTDILFEKKDFVIYNDSQCVIATYDGKDKFVGEFAQSVGTMISTNSAYRYLLVGDDSITTIQLK